MTYTAIDYTLDELDALSKDFAMKLLELQALLTQLRAMYEIGEKPFHKPKEKEEDYDP